MLHLDLFNETVSFHTRTFSLRTTYYTRTFPKTPFLLSIPWTLSTRYESNNCSGQKTTRRCAPFYFLSLINGVPSKQFFTANPWHLCYVFPTASYCRPWQFARTTCYFWVASRCINCRTYIKASCTKFWSNQSSVAINARHPRGLNKSLARSTNFSLSERLVKQLQLIDCNMFWSLQAGPARGRIQL